MPPRALLATGHVLWNLEAKTFSGGRMKLVGIGCSEFGALQRSSAAGIRKLQTDMGSGAVLAHHPSLVRF